MASERQKLLVVVDGSEQSREVVRYVAGICAPKRIEVTLFHVLSPVSESFWDQRTAPESSGTEQHGGWLTRHQAAIEVFMDGALQVLHDNGFPDEAAGISSERISVKVISGDTEATLARVRAVYETVVSAGLHAAPPVAKLR